VSRTPAATPLAGTLRAVAHHAFFLRTLAMATKAKAPPSNARAAKAARDIPTAVTELCLWFPETTTKPAHGSPDYKVRGKSFATFTVNHHGDGRVALWLAAPPGAQQRHVEDDPDCCFVPPYVGVRGWLGVRLDRDLPWHAVMRRVREAWLHIAPRALAASLPNSDTALPDVAPPTLPIDPEQFDPLSPAHIQAIVTRIGDLCLALPETSRSEQFGNPAWRAGKKTFATLHRYHRRLQLSCWVGPDRQASLTFSPRYRIPAYTGGNGWIELDLEDAAVANTVDWAEVAALIEESYRHFALQRMLTALDAARVPVAPGGRKKR
jgi:predicted DNA-binding protein (MmcQ/YjbR family)